MMRKQIAMLTRSLLPRDLKADILDFTPRLSIRALSYRMLCHAEFESYLEERAVEIVMAVDSAWKARQHISRSTLCLLAFSNTPMQRLPETLKPPPEKKQLDWDARIRPDQRLSHAVSDFTYYLRRQNNGVKEENLIAILLRVGLIPDDLDEILVADLNDLAVKRGEVAHGGASGSVSRGVNPKDEFEQVKRICEGLLPLDGKLTALLASAK